MDYALLLLYVVGPLAGAAVGVVIGGRLALQRVRELEYGLASVEARLLSEVRKRAAETRWEEKPAAETVPVEKAIDELRHLVAGDVDQDGYQRTKEGGVYRGPR